MNRLGVNIDHVATLRQQRDEGYPNVALAAETCLNNGADQITIHLREDRRHIQDHDVFEVKKVTERFSRPLNLEMGAFDEMINIAMEVRPDWICLVPESREERTTEGGLDIVSKENFDKVKKACEKLYKNIEGLKISLFVESDLETLSKAKEIGVDAVEIHTGDYAIDFLKGHCTKKHIEKYKIAKEFLIENKIGNHAGHGLTIESVRPLVEADLFVEYNIGHWIISQAVFDGLGNVVQSIKDACQK